MEPRNVWNLLSRVKNWENEVASENIRHFQSSNRLEKLGTVAEMDRRMHGIVVSFFLSVDTPREKSWAKTVRDYLRAVT